MSPEHPTGYAGWTAQLDGGLTLIAGYDMDAGWEVKVERTGPTLGRRVSRAAQRSARALAGAIVDYWAGDLPTTLGGLVTAGPLLFERDPATSGAVCRLAAGLLAFIDHGGRMHVEDSDLDADDLDALYCAEVLAKVSMESSAFVVEFGDAAVSGRRSA